MFNLRSIFSRSGIAHVCMLTAVILLGIGFGQINPGYGLAAAGLTLGMYGYLLGAE